jgi:PAS domain S-box-containing protein
MIINQTNDLITFTNNSGLVATVHFKQIVDWINEGIFCVSAEGDIIYANEQFCRNIGYSHNEIINTKIFSYFWSDEHIRFAKQKLELRKKGLSDVYESKMRKKNGTPAWVRFNGKPVFDSKGKFVATITLHTDVTQKRMLEEELMLVKEDLEAKVASRTRQLSEANQKLKEQVRERKLAQVSMANSEKRFHDVFMNSPDAIYIESNDGIILDVNQATCRLHGLTKEQLIGCSIYSLAPENQHEEIKLRQPKIAAGEIKKFESACIDDNGHEKPIEISVASILFKDRPAMLMHVRDITDRKKHNQLLHQLNEELEQKVKERTKALEDTNLQLKAQIEEKQKFQADIERQKDFLRQIIDSTPSMLYVKDSDGKYLLTNKSMADFYGLSTEEMEGHYDTEGKFNKQQLEEFLAQDEAVIQQGDKLQFPVSSYVHPSTGEIIWLSTIKKPIPSLTSSGLNILGVSTDVTALKTAKENLKISEQLYREIARNLPNSGIFIFDNELRYIVAEGALIGTISKSKEDIEGKTIYDSIHPNDITRIETIYKSILAGNISEIEQEFKNRSLKVYHIPIRNEKGEVIYGMVMIFDTSDLKKIQLELERRAVELQRSNEELERFAYVASHDLQGPLRTIASYLQLLESRYKPQLDAEASEFINYSVSGAKRMQSLIQDLLSYSRLSSTTKPISLVYLNEIIQVVINNLQGAIRQTNAEIIVGEMPILKVESSQLVQLFQNLIDNGLKFVKGKNARIEITSVEHEDEWEFIISDNGIGIREDFQERIFKIFQRLHTDNEYPGTGVGLAICKKIVLLHGGKIWFNSVLGEGTSFHFTIRKKIAKNQDPLSESSQ